jgi:NAD-dependent deacetylase
MSEHIFVLTGAGVSAESGLGTFRGDDGLWVSGRFLDENGLQREIRLEELATPEGFRANPARVCAFYTARRANMVGAEPNAAHAALARLSRELAARGGRLTLVTQNIDTLHEAAGSPEVIHMHGRIDRTLCAHCGHEHDDSGALSVDRPCPSCGKSGGLRPAVVWFGEMPVQMDLIQTRLVTADRFVAIGTSGSVYPANTFVAMAARGKIPCTEINLDRSDNAALFSERHYGPASVEVPAWVDRVIAGMDHRAAAR